MAAGFLQVPSDFSGVRNIADVVRFLSAFSQQVSQQFNLLVGVKDVYGVVSASGLIGATGSGNFGASLLTTGGYWIAFRQPFFLPPAVVAAPVDVAVSVIWALQGVTNTGFRMNIANWSANAAVNNAFHFHAKGAR